MPWTPLDPRNPYYLAACERHMERMSMTWGSNPDNCVDTHNPDGSRKDDCQREALPPNPKQAYGDKKVNVALVPPASVIYEALGLADGAVKYGPYNWREKSVEAMTYVAACMRHLQAWVDGETDATDSGKPHLGHAKACLGILADAIETGNLIDNRPPAGTASFLLKRYEKD